MTNREVARILDRIADILQIKEENPFKVRAYKKAARSVYHLDEDLHRYYERDRIGDIPGVGKAIKAQIEEMLEKGSCEYYEGLLLEVPEGVLDMLRIPGLGHKSVKTIYDNLGIDSLDELLKATEEKKIRSLPGLGAKTEYNIKKGMELLTRSEGKVTLGLALPLAESLLSFLRESKAVQQINIVGSIRRGKSLVSDIDILVASNDFNAVFDQVRNCRDVKKILKQGKDYISGQLSFGVVFEVILVPPKAYYPALVWTTGSKEFRLKAFKDSNPDQIIGAASEEEVFSRLGLNYIPPEIREDNGLVELGRSGQLSRLLTQNDLKGDLHIHSDWSDGAAKIQDTVIAAQTMGYHYVAITDHSKTLSISGGLNEEHLKAQGQVIDAINNNLKGDFYVFKGIEVDILKDGRLDFEDPILKDLDVVIASIHSHFNLDKDKQTERILKAITNGNVDIIGHLTGRLLNRRSGYEVYLDPILEAAAQNHVALEINSHPDRLDIDAEVARKAKQYGVEIAINSDAHHKDDMKLVRYGIMNARRGWLEAEDVINTWDRQRLIDFLKE
ncbi:DNA polymerase/3'-5' exonuclease PolX [Syntrophomonas erecta]